MFSSIALILFDLILISCLDTQSNPNVTTTSSANKSKPVIQTTNSSITLQKPVLVSSSNQSINSGFSIEKAAVTTSTGNSILFSGQKTPSGGTIILNADKKLSSLELVPISAATPTSRHVLYSLEGGEIGLLFTLVPKVFQSRFLFRWLKRFSGKRELILNLFNK